MKYLPYLLAAMLTLSGTVINVAASEAYEDITEEIVSEEKESFFPESSYNLNERFDRIMLELKENGFGEKIQFDMELSGYTNDIFEVFYDSFSTQVNSITLDHPSSDSKGLFHDFTKQSSELRNQMTAELKSSKEFQSVTSLLDIGSVWSAASKGLPSESALMKNNYAGKYSANAGKGKAANETCHATLQNNLLEVFLTSGDTLSDASKSKFWGATQQVQDVISGGKEIENIMDFFE